MFLSRNVTRIIQILLIAWSLLSPVFSHASIKTWTGYGGDSNWLNPLNWSAATVPQSTDDVVLDNGDLPVSYLVVLPDIAIVLRTIRISPSPGRTIELLLPVSNLVTNAFSVTGPGYGIDLNAGAVFRNASGISSGESIQIADSIIIHDGGRYIHQTRASHANSLLRVLSTAPGTEQGIFDFDIPRASYTISISNRTYGSLELHSTAYGSLVNYTCSGSNPLKVRGNLRIGPAVNWTVDLATLNGNITVDGDFIQEGGQLNLASGNGDNTILRIRGDIYQSPAATITETNNGNPFIELNGNRLQEIAMAGHITNEVGFRLNNVSGASLNLPLTIPWKMELIEGAMTTAATALLILDAGCSILIDSSRRTGCYVNGPLRKLGLVTNDHFLFPVGKNGNLRWLELKNASGNYTVEYFYQNPAVFGTNLGTGLDHISKLEYWNVDKDGAANSEAKIELSFASKQSGGVTDPVYLNVAKFQSAEWEDAGHSGTTGNFIQGSVLSGILNVTTAVYTLASTLNLENPLPLTTINLTVSESMEKPVFNWSVETDEKPDHFDLYEKIDGAISRVASVKAASQQSVYTWTSSQSLTDGDHYFAVYMVDIYGTVFPGEIVRYKKMSPNAVVCKVLTDLSSDRVLIFIESPSVANWNYELITVDGRMLENGMLKLVSGKNIVPIGARLSKNVAYVFRAMDLRGKTYSTLFTKN